MVVLIIAILIAIAIPTFLGVALCHALTTERAHHAEKQERCLRATRAPHARHGTPSWAGIRTGRLGKDESIARPAHCCLPEPGCFKKTSPTSEIN